MIAALWALKVHEVDTAGIPHLGNGTCLAPRRSTGGESTAAPASTTLIAMSASLESSVTSVRRVLAAVAHSAQTGADDEALRLRCADDPKR